MYFPNTGTVLCAIFSTEVNPIKLLSVKFLISFSFVHSGLCKIDASLFLI